MKIKTTSVASILLAFALAIPVGLSAQQRYPVPAGQRNPSYLVGSDSVQAEQRAPQQTYAATSSAATSTAVSAGEVNDNAASAQPDTVAYFNSNLYNVEKMMLKSTQIGQEYQYRIRVTAVEDIFNVVVMDTQLSDQVSVVRAEPAGELKGMTQSWKWDSMSKGEVKDILVTVIPASEGKYMTSTSVTVDPMLVLPIHAGAPKLALAKSGSGAIEYGEEVSFSIVVKNVGTAPAHDVVVTDTIPEGFTSADGSSVITHNVGTLMPGESRDFSVTLKATGKGEFVNTAEAKASNAAAVTARSQPVKVVESKIGVAKTGPETQFVFLDASYDITVTNDGERDLEDIVVSEVLPKNVKFVVASDHGQYSKGSVVWNIGNLKVGESKTVKLVISVNSPMTTSSEVVVRSASGVTASAVASTTWEGAPGVLTEIVDSADPIRVGEYTIYTIRITNQGTHSSVNANAKLTLTEELKVDSVSGQAQAVATDNEVVFPEFVLKPRGSITLQVKAKAIKSGVGHARLEFHSAFMPRAIVKEETTFIY